MTPEKFRKIEPLAGNLLSGEEIYESEYWLPIMAFIFGLYLITMILPDTLIREEYFTAFVFSLLIFVYSCRLAYCFTQFSAMIFKAYLSYFQYNYHKKIGALKKLAETK